MARETEDGDVVTDALGSIAVGMVIGLIVMIGIFMLMPKAYASTLAEIDRGTLLLYSNGDPLCSAQAVEVGDKTFVLTAAHCVVSTKSEYAVHIVTRDPATGSKVSEQVYYVDVKRRVTEADLAILSPIDATADIPTIDIASDAGAAAALTKGADVLVSGYPGTQIAPMGDVVFTRGTFVGPAVSFVPDVKKPMLRTTASVHYGNSGGGLYVEIDGEWSLVGIASQTNPERHWEDSLFSSYVDINKTLRLFSLKPATDK